MIDEFAKVVAIHPESHSVDVVVLRTGARLAAVPVLAGMASGQTGLSDLHLPDAAKGFDSDNTGKRDIVAVLAYYREAPFVVGFLFPQVAECLFKRDDFRVSRHASDVYTTVDAAGNIEIAHPSGAFVRIAESPAHENLTGQDYDKVWKIARNTGRAVHIHIEQAGGVASINIAPSGAVTVNTTSSVAVVATGPASVASSASIALTAPAIALTGVTTIGGTLAVTGDVTAGGKSLMNHTHTDPQGGSVSPPV